MRSPGRNRTHVSRVKVSIGTMPQAKIGELHPSPGLRTRAVLNVLAPFRRAYSGVGAGRGDRTLASSLEDCHATSTSGPQRGVFPVKLPASRSRLWPLGGSRTRNFLNILVGRLRLERRTRRVKAWYENHFTSGPEIFIVYSVVSSAPGWIRTSVRGGKSSR
jgi:hypothetical protein